MKSTHIKPLLGGLAILLTMLACKVASLTTPTPQTATASDTPLPVTATPMAPTATDTATSVPATASAVSPTATSTIPQLPVAASPALHALNMLDLNNGWGLTDTGVVRTMDGGTTWYDATPAGLNGAPVAPYFLNASTAWLAAMGADPTSGTLYHTTDGGATWTAVPVPFGGGSLHFMDPMNGWELVGLSAGMSHEAVSIYRTGDGGSSWSQVFTDDPNAAGSNDSLPLVGDKNGITALDSQHAWVTGAQPSDNFIYIYATQNGGITWAHQDVSLPSGYDGAMTGPSQPVFFGASEAVLAVQLFANNTGTDFYVSHDGGQSWSATKPVPQDGFSSIASATDFFVWDGSAPVQVSHDAGATWSTVTPNVNIKDNLDYLQFVNVTVGWALTADANGHCMLYKTVDGGATWNVLIP